MQGVYQGNGAGPIIWAVVSSPLLQILKEDGYGTFFQSSISRLPIRTVGFAFVDDTDLIQTAKRNKTFKEVGAQIVGKGCKLHYVHFVAQNADDRQTDPTKNYRCINNTILLYQSS